MGFLAMLLAVGLFVFSCWLLMFGRRKKHPVDYLPGPPALPLFGNVLLAMKTKDGAFRLFLECAKLYYPIYRTWQGPYPVIHPLNPKDVETVLTSSEHITKSHDYNFMKKWLGTGLLISTGSKWHKRRKLLTPAFHFKILEQFVPIFSSNTRVLIAKLREHTGCVHGVDVVPYVARCALDVICETAMGTEINAQENTTSPYVSAVYKINELILYRMMRPWLYPDWIFRLSPTGKEHDKCLEQLHGFTRKVIRERRAEYKKLKEEGQLPQNDEDLYFGGRKKTALLDLLMRASDEDDSLTEEDIREEVDTFMFEGHDTTAMAMSWALHFLAANPTIQERCMEEMVEIFGDSDRPPAMTDLAEMKYLERFIKESLRLRPSVVFFARNLEKPITLDGREFPAGTKINLHVYDFHRNPEFWPDPEKFDPDRFLPENTQGRNPYVYIPFSAGPRNCIGQRFAMLEMKSVISSLIRHFRFEAIDSKLNYEPLPDLILRPKNGIKLRITERKTTAK